MQKKKEEEEVAKEEKEEKVEKVEEEEEGGGGGGGGRGEFNILVSRTTKSKRTFLTFFIFPSFKDLSATFQILKKHLSVCMVECAYRHVCQNSVTNITNKINKQVAYILIKS